MATESQTITEWPEGIAAAFGKFTSIAPGIEWLYAGALENHSGLIESLSQTGPLLGCDPEVLRRVRDPEWVCRTLTSANLPALPLIVPVSGSYVDAAIPGTRLNNQWLAKPFASAAGIGIHEIHKPVTRAVITVSPGCYLQQKATGRMVSGLYLGTGSSTRLLGMCEQLCGESAAGAAGYLYCGSLGPLSEQDIPQSVFEQAQQIGSAFEQQLKPEGLRINGLFGIDFVLGADNGELWTLEINPRYPASAELYERAFDWPLIRWHVDACHGTRLEIPSIDTQSYNAASVDCQGKLIVYAPKDFAVPDIIETIRQLRDSLDARLSVADIPRAGSTILQSQPICTLLTDGHGTDQCRAKLLSTAAALRDLISDLPE